MRSSNDTLRTAAREPRCYRLAPELRRSAFYVLVGVGMCAALIWGLVRFNLLGAPADSARVSLLGAIALPIMLGILLVWRWTLKIDARGLSRRFLLRWDAWPWDELASGRIHKRGLLTLYDPQRPWWRRRLNLGSLAAADRCEVLELVNSVYHLPALAMPEELEIRYGWRRSLKVDWRGIHLVKHGHLRTYRWDEVLRLRIIRIDPMRRSFLSLTLSLPEESVELKTVTHEGGSSPSWRGASDEQINELLLARLPSSVVDMEVAGERPSRQSDIEEELQQLSVKARHFRIMLWCFGIPIGGMLIWMAIDSPLGALAMAGMTAIFLVPLVWYIHKRDRESRCKLEVWLAEMQAGEDS